MNVSRIASAPLLIRFRRLLSDDCSLDSSNDAPKVVGTTSSVRLATSSPTRTTAAKANATLPSSRPPMSPTLLAKPGLQPTAGYKLQLVAGAAPVDQQP